MREVRPEWAVNVLLLLHLAVGIGLLTWSRPLAAGGRSALAFAIAAVPSAATVVWLAVVAPGVVDGDVRTSHVSWIPTLGVDLDLRLDGFAVLMLTLVAGIGVLVIAYAWRYFSHPDPADIRLLGLLVLFAGAMVGLVVADNLFILYGFWELTSVTSFLLIGNRHEDPAARSAALQALLVTGFGALAMLAGFIVIGQAAGTYRLSELLADPPGGTAVTVAAAADPARCVHEVGAGAVPHVAAGGDGRPDAGQHVPALGDDGQGRRLPRRPVRSRVRPHHRAGGDRSWSASGWRR